MGAVCACLRGADNSGGAFNGVDYVASGLAGGGGEVEGMPEEEGGHHPTAALPVITAFLSSTVAEGGGVLAGQPEWDMSEIRPIHRAVSGVSNLGN
jgi:hypothetical protein